MRLSFEEAEVPDGATLRVPTSDKPPDREPHPSPVQNGPLRYFDKMVSCASRGCRSPTPWKVEGIPYCYIHAMRLMNEMLIELMPKYQNTERG